MSRYFLFTFFFLSYLIGQTTYEFEIIPLPEMDTPLRMKGDGSAIVGTNYSGMALYWTDSTGVQVLGTGELWGISENDRIFAELANDNGNWEAALIEDGETTFLGNVEGGNTCDAFYSHGLGISSDGSTGVGMGWIDCGTSAFYWTDESGIVELGQYNGGSTKAQAVSGDGQLIGGWAQTSNRSSCLWDQDGNIVFLGSLQEGNDHGEVQVITNDGTQVGGYCTGSAGNNVEGYIWTAEGGLTGLGVPSNSAATNVSRVFDLSENNIAVGEYLNETPVFYKACIYTTETGEFVNLREYLLEMGMDEIAGWDLHRALCVSDDGNTIAGYGKDPQDNWTGWVIRIIAGEDPGEVLLVPSDHSTIQGAIDASGDRDTILVAPGTYEENINYNGKNIVIGSYALLYGSSETFIVQTVIDGNGSGSVVTLNSGEDSSAVLYGFTVQNGNAEMGGGIFIESSEPTLEHLLIKNNNAEYGGGVYARYEAEPVFNSVVIENNTAGQGGGMRFRDDSNAWINDCSIIGNVSDGKGGGIYCNNADPSVSGTMIAFNSAGDAGDAVYLNINCDPNFQWSTIAFNGEGSNGSGIYCVTNCNPTFDSSIIWGNGGPQIEFSSTSNPNSVSVSASDLEGDMDSIVTNGNGEVHWGEGNISDDPLFCDIINGDLSLAENSPCLYMGTMGASMGAINLPGCGPVMFGIDHEGISPDQVSLGQNYPNPFNLVTSLHYYLPEDSRVNITIYDVKGKQVKTLVNDQRNAGFRTVEWNATSDAGKIVTGGLYFYMIQIGDLRQTKKMVLLK